MTETWKPIPNFEGRFEVSDHGRVRSVERSVRSMLRSGRWGTRRIVSRVLKTHTWGAKYPGIVLHDHAGRGTRKMVHQIVAEVFVPNPDSYTYINHIDADKGNCRADNLEWCSQSMNVAHSYRIGNRPTGTDHHFAKLPRDRAGRCLSGGWAEEAF